MAIQDTDKIDSIVEDRDGASVRLQMLEAREWSLSDVRIVELEDKISAYFNFIASGQLAKHVPKSTKAKVIVELVCQHEPPTEMLSMFPQVRLLFAQRKIDFQVIFARNLGGSLAELKIFP
jgi:hypothetical protein